MTDIGGLTLEQLEALATRAKAAADTLQAATAMFRGGGVAPVAHPALDVQRSPVGLNRPTSAQVFTPEQQAEIDTWRNSPQRQKLLEAIREEKPDLPDDIKRAHAT